MSQFDLSEHEPPSPFAEAVRAAATIHLAAAIVSLPFVIASARDMNFALRIVAVVAVPIWAGTAVVLVALAILKAVRAAFRAVAPRGPRRVKFIEDLAPRPSESLAVAPGTWHPLFDDELDR